MFFVCDLDELTNEESETTEREAERREICMGIASWPLQPNRTKLDCMRLPFVSLTPSLPVSLPHPGSPPHSPSSPIYITWL